MAPSPSSTEQQEQQEQQAAATRVQAAQRGRKTRKGLAEQREAATRVQAVQRGRAVRRRRKRKQEASTEGGGMPLVIDVPESDAESAPGSTVRFSSSARVTELLGRLDSADDQLGEFGRTPKGQRTPTHIRSAGAEMWEQSSLEHTWSVRGPSLDEQDAATKLQAARRGTLARREYNAQVAAASHIQAVHRGHAVRRHGSLLVLVPPEPIGGGLSLSRPQTPVTPLSLEPPSPTQASISLEAARQRRRVAQAEIQRLTDQIAVAQSAHKKQLDESKKVRINSEKELANSQSALGVKESHLKDRMARLARAIEASEYAFQQSEIIVEEREAAIMAMRNKLEFQEFQTNKEAEFAADMENSVREEIAATKEVEARRDEAKANADAAGAEASAALKELGDAKQANAVNQAELKAAVHAEKRAARARATLKREIKMRGLQLKQEQQESVVAQQEADRVRDRLRQYGGEIDAKLASLARALQKTQAAQSEADKLKLEAEELAAKSKQVVAKQSDLIIVETDEMHKAEDKALRLLKKQAMQLRKEQIALDAAEAVKPPPGAPQPKQRASEVLPTITGSQSQPELSTAKSAKAADSAGGSKATKAARGKPQPRADSLDAPVPVAAVAKDAGAMGDANAARPLMMLPAPRRRNVSRRQAGSRQQGRRRMQKQRRAVAAASAEETSTVDASSASASLEHTDADRTGGSDTVAPAQLEDAAQRGQTGPTEPNPAATAQEQMLPAAAAVSDNHNDGSSTGGFGQWGTMEGLAPIDYASFEIADSVADNTAKASPALQGHGREGQSAAGNLLDEAALASIGAHVTQDMTTLLMRQAPSLSFLKILTTSERMQYLRPLTPGSGGRSNGSSSSSSAKSKAQLRGSGAGTVGTRTRSRRTKGAAGTRRQKTKQPPRSSSSGGGKAAGGETGAENRPDTQQQQQQERLGSQLETIDALEKHISLLAQEGEALTTEIKDDLDQERQAAEALAQARKLAGVADDSTSGGGGGGGLQRSASAFTMQDMLDMAGENKPPKKEEWNSSGLHPNE
jgi:hypothetical protein